MPATNPATMPAVAQQFFTLSSFLTFAGASVIVAMLTTVVARLTKRVPPPWCAFVIALAVSFYGAHLVQKIEGFNDGVIAFLNGCLLFTSATGAYETIAAIPRPQPAGGAKVFGEAGDSSKTTLMRSWFRRR
jgi:hypothetical protein